MSIGENDFQINSAVDESKICRTTSDGAIANVCRLCGSNALVGYVDFDEIRVIKCLRCKSCFHEKRGDCPDDGGTHNNYSERYEQERLSGKPDACWKILNDNTDGLKGIHTVLDIGCGEGDFISLAKASGLEAHGVEISSRAAMICKDRHHHVYCCSIDDPSMSINSRYDLCVVWDLLEHLSSPGQALENISRLLVPGGHVMIITPMNGSVYDHLGMFLNRLAPRLAKRLLRMCWSNEHLFRFDPVGIDQVLRNVGFVGVRIEPTLLLSLQPSRYAGGAVMAKWTGNDRLNNIISKIAVSIARLMKIHNKIIIHARRVQV